MHAGAPGCFKIEVTEIHVFARGRGMAFTIEIIPSAKLAISTFTGTLSGDDMEAVGRELAQHPDFDPKYSHILDFRGVTATTVSPDFLRAFAEQEPVFSRTAKQVGVAPQPHIFGLARMLQILRESRLPNIAIVRTLSEAYKALGIEQAG